MSNDPSNERKIETEGGSYIEGDVNTNGGSFVGRDKIDQSVNIHGDATIITGDVLFQLFSQTPLAYHIRVQAFQTLVNERTRNFVGREYVFTAIDRMLSNPSFPSGYIVIRGEPGIGKTSLLSKLVKDKGYIHHFNISTQNIRLARDFLTNTCAQLIARYKLNHAVLPLDADKDSGFLSQLLAEAAKDAGKPVIVLIDALDEAEDMGLPPTANRLYLPPALPDGVYFIVSTREKSDERLFVDRRQDIFIRDDDPQNLDDVLHYIQDFIQVNREQMIAQIQNWGVTEQEFAKVFTEKSQGNFMYLVYVLGDIRAGKLGAINIDNIRDLPQGLQEYYKRHWRQMRDGNEKEFDILYGPIVCILGVAQEPVTIQQIADWTKLNQGQVKTSIQAWREFLEEERVKDQNRYRIYHASFQEFLKEQVDLTRYDDMIIEYYLSLAGGES